MTLLVLQGRDRTLGATGDHLCVRVEGKPVQTLSPASLDAVWLEGPVALTPAARRLLLRAELDVTFLDGRGRWQGRLVGSDLRGGTTRLRQAAAVLDPARRLALARSMVDGKLHNTSIALQRIRRVAPDAGSPEALGHLRALRAKLVDAEDVPTLMGLEGAAARRWFEAFGRALQPPDLVWTGRNRRPPQDPVNAALSYVYTLLCAETDAAARRAGLDPALGLLHETGRGKPACGLDLAEEWRPLVDVFVLSLFNRHQLTAADTESPEANPTEAPEADADGTPADTRAPPRPVYLSAHGRRVVLAAWADRLDVRLRDPILGTRCTLRDLVRRQAQRLATAVREGGTYTPYRWK